MHKSTSLKLVVFPQETLPEGQFCINICRESYVRGYVLPPAGHRVKCTVDSFCSRSLDTHIPGALTQVTIAELVLETIC